MFGLFGGTVWEGLEGMDFLQEMCHRSGLWGFKSRSQFLFSLCLMFVFQDVSSQLLPLPACCHVSWHDDRGLTLWNCELQITLVWVTLVMASLRFALARSSRASSSRSSNLICFLVRVVTHGGDRRVYIEVAVCILSRESQRIDRELLLKIWNVTQRLIVWTVDP